MKDTFENKRKFFALYWGQKVCDYNFNSDKKRESEYVKTSTLLRSEEPLDNWSLNLKPLSKISDEDAIEIGKIVHERYKSNFILERMKDIIHISHTDKFNIKYHVCLNYKYSTLNANVSIPNDNGKIERYKHNIGEIHVSSRNPVAYIMVLDFLRSKGYALPFLGILVEEMIEFGWIKLDE